MNASTSSIARFLKRLQTRQSPACLGLLGACILVLIGSSAFAQSPSDANSPKGMQVEAVGPRKWALLVGVEKYQNRKAPPLSYTINDVRQIAATLQDRGDYPRDNICQIVDSATEQELQPLCANLLKQLPEFLKKPDKGDHVLIYFSGHGFRDKAGKLYLAPIDCDPENPAETGIAVDWLRQQLASCKPKFKLLVLDACHAGNEKGEAAASVSARDLGIPFQDMENVVTLASSSGDEQSQIWNEKQQSLFSYWLNQGLKGHADLDADGMVTIDELYKYVYRQVLRTTKNRSLRAQTPVRIVRSGTPGVPEVVRLQPQRLKALLAEMAEQLAWSLEERQLTKVGVLEFTNDTKLGELLGADFGLLGRYCAEELEQRLTDLAATGKFSVLERRRLQTVMQAQNFGLADLGSDTALKDLSKRAGGMPAIALGTLRNRNGRVVTLQCKLVRTEQEESAGGAGGVAVLNESEWAMIGRSARVRPEDRRPERPAEGQPVRPISAQVIRKLDERAEGPHPLLDQTFPFPVKIMVKNRVGGGVTERKGVFRGNDLFIPLSKGEVYEIWVENHSEQTVLMRLLVDGLNTQLEKVTTKGLTVEPVGESQWIPAKCVNLSNARGWILAPQDAPYAVRGFVTKTGKSGLLREFKVTDAQDSLAGRQNFTDQLGVITAAFYARKADPQKEGKPRSRGIPSIGTDLGNEKQENLEEDKEAFPVGDLLAVVHLRYVEPESLEKR